MCHYVMAISTRQRKQDTLAYQRKQFAIIEEVKLFNNTILFEDVPRRKLMFFLSIPAKKNSNIIV